MDGLEKDRKLDDLAWLLRDYLGILEDIVRSSMPGDDPGDAIREICRRAMEER